MRSLPRKGLNPTQHIEENDSLQPAIATPTEESNRDAVTAQLLKLNLYFSKPNSCHWLRSWETKAAKAEGSVYVKYVVPLPARSLPPSLDWVHIRPDTFKADVDPDQQCPSGHFGHLPVCHWGPEWEGCSEVES